MHLRKVLLAAVAVTLIAFSVGLRGQGGFVDGIKVNLPEPVTVGDKVLEPGEYEIRRASQFQDQILRIYNRDKMVYETNVLTIPTVGEKTPEDSKVVLHHIGDNYYFDKIWIEGKDYGYEFRLPERVEALQRELAVNVPAKVEPASSQDQVAQVQPEAHQGPGLSEQLDAVAAQQESERQAALTQPQPQPENNQVAALQPEPPPVVPSGQPVAQEPQQSQQPPQSIQSGTQTPEQLPETATNWLAFVVGGVLLLTLSLFFRPRMQE